MTLGGDCDVVYALFSGGHDSLCSTALAARDERFAGVVHLNTGIGVAQTREFVVETCAAWGWPLVELHPDTTYETLVLERGGFPYGVQSHNSFLWHLKQRPLARWVKSVDGRVGLVTGIRKAESVRRMGAGISVPVRRDGRKTWLSPILDWTKVDCNRFLDERGLERNQVVDLIHRSAECLCGALARSDEIHEIARWFPDVARRINALERECEARGIVASVWAGRDARKQVDGQAALFSKADLAPLCTSCEASYADA